MLIKECKTIEQYKICEWLSNELSLSDFTLTMMERNVVKVTDITGAKMLIKYEDGEFKKKFME